MTFAMLIEFFLRLVTLSRINLKQILELEYIQDANQVNLLKLFPFGGLLAVHPAVFSLGVRMTRQRSQGFDAIALSSDDKE